MARISQREARRLQKRVHELQEQEDRRRRAWSQDWFGGVEICRTKWGRDDPIPTATRTANRLKHAVVVLSDEDGTVRFLALPLAKA